jgi:hypothetical protein
MLRVLILSLLIPACVWPVAAQSSSDKIPLASWLPVSQSDPQLEFRQRASALSQNSHTKQTNPSRSLSSGAASTYHPQPRVPFKV